ncbi:hypothetical protein J6590_055209 [Homalodisca vitripennis]|nr:hypothetical protein J6590_055209 [Homalodisca vitripennis]
MMQHHTNFWFTGMVNVCNEWNEDSGTETIIMTISHNDCWIVSRIQNALLRQDWRSADVAYCNSTARHGQQLPLQLLLITP